MCLGVASKIAGTVVHEAATAIRGRDELLVSMPSGVLQLSAEVNRLDGAWHAVRGGFYRTQRRLFEGNLLVRAAALR